VDLQAELARKDIEIAANAAEIHAKTLHIEKLKMQLAVLRRARFGRSSEKLDHAIEQLELLIGELEADAGAAEARDTAGDPDARQPGKRRERKHPVRKPLPPHLPRETVTHEAACSCPGCGGTVFSRIGQDEREVLEYVPSSFKVIRHIRPKLSCRACETIVQPPMPSLPIERGRPGPGLLAQVLVAKFCDHTPLHRQAGIYAREGVELDRSTLADWVGQSVFLLDPLAEAIGRHVRAGQVLHADDTTVPVLAPGTGKTRTGRLWVVVRDERPFGSDIPPAAYYRYSPDRKGIHAQALLGGCRGFLHADGYAGFDRLYQPATPDGAPPLIEVACWSHVRRKFYDVHHASASPIALEAMERIAALFVIESSVRGQPPAQRLAARVQYARPRLDELKLFLQRSLNRISGKSRARRCHPLCPYTMERTAALPGGWSARDEQQRRRAGHACARSGAQKLSLLWLRCRRTTRRLCLYHRRIGKDVPHQSAGLSCRCSRTHRGSSNQQDRRPAPLALDTIVQVRGSTEAPMPRS
jgi:transposase